jgi:hypothetical protein
MSAANRLYAIDLLNRAGIDVAPHIITAVAAIVPLLEHDVLQAVGEPADGVFFTAQAIVRARIAEGRHRPSGAAEASTPGLHAPPQPGDPAAAPLPGEGAAAFSESTAT